MLNPSSFSPALRNDLVLGEQTTKPATQKDWNRIFQDEKRFFNFFIWWF